MSVNSERTECIVDSVSTFTSTDISEEVNTIADDDCDVVLNDKASMEKAVSQMQRILPSITCHLAEQGRLSEWMSFFNLVDNWKFMLNT